MDVAIGSVDRGVVEFLLKSTAVDELCERLEEALKRKKKLEDASR